ncbi:MAG TPA: hypothetical protein VGG39_04335 [Polyangiaceae bacterium]|jgi:hypothetical protein
MRKLFSLGLALGIVTAAGSAAAQYPPPPPPPPGGGYGYAPQMPVQQRFGDQGQLVLSNDMNFGFAGQSTSNNGGSNWTLTLQPAVDYFVIPNLSIGGIVIFTHTEDNPPNNPGATTNGSTSVNVYGIGARVGYNVAITDGFSFWPKLALLYAGSSTSPPGGGNGVSTSAFDVQIFAPFLLHPVKHFFLGIGPFVQTDLTASQSLGGVNNPNPGKTTEYGLMFDLGGWMDF